MVNWLIDQFVVSLVGLLFGWLDGYLVSWLGGW